MLRIGPYSLKNRLVIAPMAGAPARWLMDCLLPAALFARDPDRPERFAGLARMLLLARSHWIRMPPLLLASHLSRKLLQRTGAREKAGA